MRRMRLGRFFEAGIQRQATVVAVVVVVVNEVLPEPAALTRQPVVSLLAARN
jgi:Mg2+/Co2+ transporter CorB